MIRMLDLQHLKSEDPLRRNAQKDDSGEEFSPMDPPDAYTPPNLAPVAFDELHPFLQQLMREHLDCLAQLDAFEKALLDIQTNGISREADKTLRDFFDFFDNNIVRHNQKEEKRLFPILHRRLLESGEHGQGVEPLTAVNVLEDDHAKALQMAAVAFNFFALSVRLPDPASRAIVLDAALEQGKELVETLKLHIFREDNIAFAQAHRLIDAATLDQEMKQW